MEKSNEMLESLLILEALKNPDQEAFLLLAAKLWERGSPDSMPRMFDTGTILTEPSWHLRYALGKTSVYV